MFENNTVYYSNSVIDVLKKLDRLPNTKTIFVLCDDNKVVGTITDGDVRRALINGHQLNEPLSNFYNANFKYLTENEDNFGKLKVFRKLKLKAVPLLNKNNKLVKIYDFSVLKSILPIDAVIMAGGKGQRLRPLTNTIPKPLLKVGGKEIISYNLDRLFQFGITQQYVTVNYLKEQIINYCENYNEEISFSLVEETEFLGTAGALSLIDRFKNDTILLMNSDLLTNIDYEDFYKSFVDKRADLMVASIPYEINLPYAIFEAKDRIVESFKEKPNYTYYANAGIYLIKRELLNLIPKNKVYNATDLMDDVIRRGYKLIHYPIRNYWLDIGNHEDFEKAQKDIAHIDFD